MPRMCVETSNRHACTGSNATALPSEFLFADLLGLTTNNSNEPPSPFRPEKPESSGGTLPVAAVAGGGAAALAVIVVAVVGALIVKRRRDRKEMTQHKHSRTHAKSAAEGGPSARPSGSGGTSHAYAQISFQGHGNNSTIHGSDGEASASSPPIMTTPECVLSPPPSISSCATVPFTCCLLRVSALLQCCSRCFRFLILLAFHPY
jgi:hypothetical protein